MIDLTPELIRALPEALRSPEVRAALAEAVVPAVMTALAEGADALLSIHEAAVHVGLSYTAFKARLRDSADLQALRIGAGRMSRFKRRDLTAWVEKVKPGSKPWGGPRKPVKEG